MPQNRSSIPMPDTAVLGRAFDIAASRVASFVDPFSIQYVLRLLDTEKRWCDAVLERKIRPTRFGWDMTGVEVEFLRACHELMVPA